MKLDSKRYEEQKEKDRQRKRRIRAEKKQKLKRNKKLLDEERRKNREEKSRYRAKKRAVDFIENKRRSKAGQKNQQLKRNFFHNETLIHGRQLFEKETSLIKKDEIKERKREVMRVQQWRLKVKLRNYQDKNNSPTKGFSSPSQKSRHLNKIKKVMPKTPEKRADLLVSLTKSPTCRKILERKGVLINQVMRGQVRIGSALLTGIGEVVNDLKPTGTLAANHKKAYDTLQQTLLHIHRKYRIMKPFKLSWKAKLRGDKWWDEKLKRKPRKDRTPPEVTEEIAAFYCSPTVSRIVPDSKAARKENNTFIPTHVMTMTLSEAYDQYKEEYCHHKVGFSTFKRLKPTNVKKISETSLRQALCQKCCNAALKAEALKRYTVKTDINSHIVELSKHKAADLTLCDLRD